MVISGFGLSAFLFSTVSHVLFPGNTSDFLLILALGTSIPMILGFFVLRTIPLPTQDGTHSLEHAPPESYQPLSPSDHFHHINSSHTHLLSHDDEDEDVMRPDVHRRVSGESHDASIMASMELSPSIRNLSRSRSRSVATSHRRRTHEKTAEGHHIDISGRALWSTLDFWIIFTMNILCTITFSG